MHDDNCIFCRIARGEIPSAKIYEDDGVLAFLDMGPVRPGHTLIIPKRHFANLLEMPEDAAPELIRACKAVGGALMAPDGNAAEGFNVMQNNFPAAGQTVFHVHWHVIPRNEGDGLSLWQQGTYADAAAMRALAGRIAAKLEYSK